MSRIQLAFMGLAASAFILAGLLLVNLKGRWVNPAEASLVLNKDTFTLMTAQTRSDEEALFVLDNLNQKLLIYRLNLGRNQLELVGDTDLPNIFSGHSGDVPTDAR